MSGGFTPEQVTECGRKLLDLADRVRVADKIVPGAGGELTLRIDGVEFVLLLKVKGR